MTSSGKILIWFSLTAILAATGAAQLYVSPVHEHHARCHQPVPETPAPASYSCCQAGHDSLLLLNPEPTRLLVHFGLSSFPIVQPLRLPHFFTATAPSSSPPPGFSAPLALRV